MSLHAAGIEGRRIEGAPDVRPLGVGINLLPHAVRELTELDLGDELAETGVATGELAMPTHGQRIWAEHRGRAAGYRWPQYSIHRGRLLGVLHRAVVQRLGVARFPHRLPVGFSDGAGSKSSGTYGDVSADVLVAADGVHSVIRLSSIPTRDRHWWNGAVLAGDAGAAPFLGADHGRHRPGPSRRRLSHRRCRTTAVLTNVVLEAKTAAGQPMPRQDWNHPVNRDEVRAVFGTMRFDWLDVPASSTRPSSGGSTRWWTATRCRGGRSAVSPCSATPPIRCTRSGRDGASQAIIDARVLARALASSRRSRRRWPPTKRPGARRPRPS